ncbi:MAG: hypothetical protein J6A49_10630 [Clostridia bacterium]|nr:hypothetical protein [Clostridia bacterium]
MSRTDNPVADFERYDAVQERAKEKLPRCSECGEPIQDDFFYDFDCYFYCADCVSNHRKSTEDFIS